MDLELLTQSFMMRLVYGIIAVLMSYYVLRLLDKLANQTFKDNLNEFKKDSVALSMYYSARLISVSIIISSIFG